MLYFLPNAPEKTALFYPKTNRSACKAHTPGTQEKGAPHTRNAPLFSLPYRSLRLIDSTATAPPRTASMRERNCFL